MRFKASKPTRTVLWTGGIFLLALVCSAPAADTPADAAKAENVIAKKFAEASKKQLNQPLSVLEKIASQLGRSINASADFDLDIARAKSWEKNLRLTLANLRGEADRLRDVRKKVRAKLDAAVTEARQRLANDPTRLDAEVVELVQHFGPQLAALKDEENAYTRDADTVAARLDEVTRRRERLERSKAWAADSHTPTNRREPIILPDLKSLDAGQPPAADRAAPAAGATTAEAALHSLKAKGL